jgi:hypothetical protein
MTEKKPERSFLEALDTPVYRPVVKSVGVYIVLWYALYVTAWAPADPPLWALNYIEQLKPIFGALETAARLNEYPFPTQVMILYAFVSSPLLGLYWAYSIFGAPHFWQDTYRAFCEQYGHTGLPIKTRLLGVACGVVALSCCWYIFPVQTLMGGGYWYNGHLNGWLKPSMFSTSILSTTWFLFLSVGVAMAWVFGPLFIYMSLVRLESPTSGRG